MSDSEDRQNRDWGKTAIHATFLGMTLKEQIHDLVNGLPDDSPLLVEVREALRMNRAIGEALNDVREGRTYHSEEFTAKVQERWPRKAAA